MDHPLFRLTHDDYTVACICPMGVELAPVEAILDEMHQSLPASRDKNSYTLGRIGAHNVVIWWHWQDSDALEFAYRLRERCAVF